MIAIILTCISAFLHAGWNFVVKNKAKTLSFYAFSNALCVLILLPAYLMNIDITHALVANTPWLIMGSIIFQIIYLTCLFQAYDKGEMSIIYPLARTLPIPIAFATEWITGSDKSTSSFYLLSLIILCIGSVLLASIKNSSKLGISILFALFAACAISGYSLFDYHILKSFNSQTDFSKIRVCLAYMFILEAGITFGFLLPAIFLKQFRKDLVNDMKCNKTPCFQMSFGMTGAYVLVLIAMTYTQQASLVIAFRQLSIPIGFLLGVLILKESSLRMKWVGMLTICFGLIVLGVNH